MKPRIESSYNLFKDAADSYKTLKEEDPALKKDQDKLQRLQERCNEAYKYLIEQEEKDQPKGLDKLVEFAIENGLIDSL